MKVLTQHSDSLFERADWQPEVLSLLEERHLVAWSQVSQRRNRFSARLARFLSGQPDAETCVLHGRSITNIEGLCAQLERLIPCDRLERRIDGSGGITELLRQNEWSPGHRPACFRYFIWNDSDVLLRSDPDLFNRVADVMAGVAAESEYGDTEGLLIQRTVYIGGPLLEEVAHELTGPFRSWLDDGAEEPFWRLVSGLECPPMACRPVDLLMRTPRARTA